MAYTASNGMKTDTELDPELKKVAREGGTEAPFSGKYWDEHAAGMYKCAICGTELFSSDAKFDSGTGWPSFTNPSDLEHIELVDDGSHGMSRTEVKCKTCGAHLGHVFDDLPAQAGGPVIEDGGPPTPGASARRAKRYCINSVCLELEEK